jgi:hypothetical protein
MASDDPSGPRPAAPIVLRIKLRYDDVEVMVQRFATNVGKSGLFLPTRSIQPIGAEVKFELRLADDTPAIVGLGRVKAATPPDPANPKATFGMAIELMRVTPQSRALILRMLERRRAMGLPEIGLPMTADIDAARRAEAAAAPVVPVVPVDAAAGDALLTAPRRITGPIAVAKVLAVAPLAPEPPRRKRIAMSELIESASGPIASVSVSVLDDDVDVAAAVVRARALAGDGYDAELEALAEVAAAPLEISIEAASAELARQLGGSGVRRDRSARWAVPPATATAPAGPPVHDAGKLPVRDAAELPVRDAGELSVRDAGELPVRDAGELPVRDAGELPVRDAEPPPGQAVDAPHAEAAQEAALDLPAAPAGAAPLDALAEPAHEADAGAFSLPYDDQVAVEPEPRASSSGRLEIEPGQIAEELHQLSELDLEDVEHTELGDAPPAPAGHGDEPRGLDEASAVDHELLAARLEAQLAEAEAEAEADALGLAAALGAAAVDDPAAGAGGGIEPAGDGPDDAPLDLSLEEIDDFEILAEADADDEDLLAAHGEQEASDSRERFAAPRISARRARVSSELDFAARLDLGDDSDRHFVAQDVELSAHHVLDAVRDDLPLADRLADSLLDELAQPPGPRDPLIDSAGHALAGFDTGDDPLDEPAASDSGSSGQPLFGPDSTGSFTIAGIPSDSLDLEPPSPVRSAPAATPRPARSQRAPAPGEPAILRAAPSPLAPSLHSAPVEDHELEHALEALDVDLDDLSIPHAATHLALEAPKPRPVAAARYAPPSQVRVPRPTPVPSNPGRPSPAAPVAPASGRGGAPRITTEDGVVIDFDDDD